MKKLLCLLLLSSTLALTAQNEQMRNLMRTTNPFRNSNVIPASSVQFWVGQGSNEVVAAFFSCGNSAPGGVAYGFRFNGTATILDMLNAIDAADPNFSINISGSLVDDYSYDDGNISYFTGYGMLFYTVDGTWAGGLDDQLTNGNYFEMCEWGSCTLPNDNVFFPVDPNASGNLFPPDASISADDLSYWVGAGEHRAILAVNWCDTAVAMAWGVRFSGDSILVADLMNTVRIYDPRFNFIDYDGMMSDITFHDSTYNLSLHGNWWMYNINGASAWNGFRVQKVGDGDLVKWGDESCGLFDENYNYSWTAPIHPVSLPTPADTLFDGIVGSEGCQAISYDNPFILGWATSCTVTRGPEDIANSTTLASYGEESVGIGASGLSTLDAVSLGDGGSAVLSFGQPIRNGEGYDFAVFENALNDIFLEQAFVEVSSDGIHYYRFPAVSNTPTDEQIGNGGAVDARHLHNLAGKYRVGWGVPFDLEELTGYSNLDLDNITHVRLVDVVGSINPLYGTTDRNGHLINEPYPTAFTSCGFDLSGVAILNGWIPNNINDHSATNGTLTAYPNPCSNTLFVDSIVIGETVKLYNAFGQLIWSETSISNQITVPMQHLPAGFYIVQTGAATQKVVKR